MRNLAALLCVAVAWVLPPTARAGGGNYLFQGGTRAERQVVISALEASSFEWDLVPAAITIHIAHGADSVAVPGEIWLDANLLDAGTFARGVVQHEYAHEVDYFLLDDVRRARILPLLGGSAWCYDVAILPHAQYGCERFASTLAWSYWPSADNCMKPEGRGDESAAMPPRRFRAFLDALLQPRKRVAAP